jgi:hypothetical protein
MGYDRRVSGRFEPDAEAVHILSPQRPLEEEVRDKLRDDLASCPDVAFAHLADVAVGGGSAPEPALFVWLRADALRSVRSALNLVAEAVSRSLPDDRYLDVVILNSAPELLDAIEANGELVVENDAQERLRAREAASDLEGYAPLPPRRRWWWPF